MPCQCGTTATAANEAESAYSGCGCATESNASCECASPPAASDAETSLERVVMELDKRVRKLEASR